ncbi:MAG TPA: transketolase family protein, partial [Spirochaetia bacterium]|nr:transketolase family protein [Spirochaetia bacterium]
MERAALREALGNELVELARKDERIVVLDADLATSTKVDTFSRVFPERFFQMGVTEQNMIGVAAGISTLGYIPFVSTFACFVAKRTLDQIRLVVAQPRLNV